jgi:uncharacterized protein YcbK (DUF882 family)
MADRGEHTRRAALFLAGGVLASALAGPASAAIWHPVQARSIALHNVHTGERVNNVYWENGKYVPETMHAINWVLRDFHTDEVLPIRPELVELLSHLHERLRSREPFQVLSGYRCPATNAMLAEFTDGVAQNSLHMQGMAIDIRVPDRSLVKVHRAALSLEAGGVGFYPRSDFVHVDVGRVRRW